MKVITQTLPVLVLLVAATNGYDVVTQSEASQESQSTQVGQVYPASDDSASNQVDQRGPCTLTGKYTEGTDVSHCGAVVIDSLSVPAGVTLDLSNVTHGVNIKFEGVTTSEAAHPTTGYQLDAVGFNLVNVPYRTFSIGNSNYTTITGVTLNSIAGNGVAKNTDGFDLSKNDHFTITGNRIYNQDDCLAMQSSTNTVFSNNYCSGGHGISLGSLGGEQQDASTTVAGLLVSGNTIANSDNGIRIKTITGLKGLVTDAMYINNKLVNVKNAIVMHSDYNKTKGGYSGTPDSLVNITNVKIENLSGSATNLYDIVANPDVVSNWLFSNIAVNATNNGQCKGEPSSVQC